MSIGPESAAVLLEAGLSLVERVAPAGIAWVESWLKGRTILVVGPPRAGKSTFVDYLENAIFEKEKRTSKTPDIVPTARFNVKINNNKKLVMYIKKAEDTPGQIGPVAMANLAFEKRPHGLIIFLDLTMPLTGNENSGAEWLRAFCKRLEKLWLANRNDENPLKTVIVVLSKEDKAEQATIDKYTAECEVILEAEFRMARGQMTADIPITPCVLVKTPQNIKPESLDSVLVQMAKGLK